MLLSMLLYGFEVHADVSAAFIITSSWATGLNGQITVTNNGSAAVNGWTFEFDFPGTITNSWNGTITSHVGTHYVVQNAAYNAAIAVNANVAVGFTADPATAAQPPANYFFNGAAVCSGGNPQITTASLPAISVGTALTMR